MIKTQFSKVDSRRDREKIYETSSHGGYFTANVRQLELMFSKSYDPGDGKTSHEWVAKLGDTVFTIYNYNSFPKTLLQKIEWHIGTRTAEDTERVILALKEYFTAYREVWDNKVKALVRVL